MRRARGLAALIGLTLACGETPTTPPPPEAQLPKAEVEILIDERGIPHIYAQSDEDLFFAYGYQLASDRMLQLEMFRRYAHGELSEVLGADGPGAFREDALTDDKFAKVFDWKRWGKLDAEWMKENDPEQYALTSAWADGINRRIEEIEAGTTARPYGFGPEGIDRLPTRWTHEDVYIVQKMVGFGLDQTILYEVLITFLDRLHPEALEAIELFKPARPAYILPEGERPESALAQLGRGAPGDGSVIHGPPILRAADSPLLPPDAFDALGKLHAKKALGSNNWALDGRHTANGKPLIAGDPHLGYSFAGMMYALHLNSADAGGTFDNVGFAFVAVPGMFAGHNRSFAYTPTSAFADVMDMWAIKIEDGVAKVGGEDVPVSERTETITIKGADPLTVTVVDVPGYGVVLDHALVGSPVPFVGFQEHALVGWTGYKARPARYFRPLMRATNLDEFEAAVDAMPEMMYNFVGADAEGISYRVGVEIPARNQPAEGRKPWMVMDGSDPESFWPEGKSLTTDQKPHTRALERGWIATANNDPFGFTDDGRLEDDPWYYGSVFVDGWRAARIESELERLAARGAVTAEDMMTLQTDVHSGLADDLLPVVAEAYAAVGTDPELAEYQGRTDLDTLVALLTVDWDRRMAREEPGALAFHAFSHLLTIALMKGDINDILLGQVLDAAPMYLLKITALALNDQYPNGADVIQEGKNKLILMALDETAAFLTERFGGVDPSGYSYSDLRVSSMDHAYGRPFDLQEVPTDGGEDTVNVAQSKFLNPDGSLASQWVSHWGPIERQVMSFGDDGVPEAWANFPMGNVGDPASPHFDDELDAWVEGSYEKLLFERAEIEAAEERRVVLPAAK
jgi:penicillin amidase